MILFSVVVEATLRKSIYLGTANFGLPYGVGNNFERKSLFEVEKILSSVAGNIVSGIDTAQVYGDSERIIGHFSNLVKRLPISTKIASVSDISYSGFLEAIETSSLRLKRRPSLVYFHNLPFFLGFKREDLERIVDSLRERGEETKLGVSVYNISEISQALEHFPEIQIFQVPFSVLDCNSEYEVNLERLSVEGVSLIARSIFLQGILIMPLDDVRLKVLTGIELETLRMFHDFCQRNNLTPLQASLEYMKVTSCVGGFVFGVDAAHQIQSLRRILDDEVKIAFNVDFGKTENMFNLRETRFNKGT